VIAAQLRRQAIPGRCRALPLAVQAERVREQAVHLVLVQFVLRVAQVLERVPLAIT
jgi:hypothetical protein